MEAATNIDRVLQRIAELTVEEQFYVADILNKRLIQTSRDRIAARVREAEDNYRQGKVYSGDVARLMVMSEDD
jgi:hypothetical protein